MGSLSRGLRCAVGVALLASGAAALQSRAEPYWSDATTLNSGAQGAGRRDEYPLFGISPSADRLIHQESGLDIGARHWSALGHVLADSVAFGNVSGRFELGHSQGLVLFAGADDASASLALIGVQHTRATAAPRLGPDRATDDIFRTLRESLIDHADGANFSLAGVELNVSLKGGQRSVTVNGFDVLPVLQEVAQRDAAASETGPAFLPTSTPRAARTGMDPTAMMLAEAEAFATHPITLFLSAAFALGYLFVRAWAKVQDLGGRRR